MVDIVLATQNATYAHTALGLRSLCANLGDLRGRAVVREFVASDRPSDVAEKILSDNPRIVGLGVYVWNARAALELVTVLKRVRPEVTVVVGGPEVSFEPGEQPLAGIADYVICGEAEHAFRELAASILGGQPKAQHIIEAPPPALETVALPHLLFDEHDLRERTVYVEASRGCPFACEFCLSARGGRSVRQFPLAALSAALESLWARGLRRYRFTDRTFNVDLQRCLGLLSFLRERATPDTFVHLELVPEQIPEELCAAIASFPAGCLQLEVGVQTLNEEVSHRIGRTLCRTRVLENLRRLRACGAHLHTDLIVGLPGESEASFARGFDELVRAGPHEIQVGILKLLRGAPIARHAATWRMVYSPEPPYEILQTSLIDFAAMQRLKRFARVWDTIANSGNFRESTPLVWGTGSPTAGFLALSQFITQRAGRTHALSLERVVALLLDFLAGERGLGHSEVREILQRDYVRAGRRPLPLLGGEACHKRSSRERGSLGLPPRQARHRDG